jgi:hypothetical protein
VLLELTKEIVQLKEKRVVQLLFKSEIFQLKQGVLGKKTIA